MKQELQTEEGRGISEHWEALRLMVKSRIAVGEERRSSENEWKVDQAALGSQPSENAVNACYTTLSSTGVSSSSRWEPEFGVEKTCISAQKTIYKVGEKHLLKER